MSTAVKRACDACHRRKVKCDGINPCRNCSAAQLGCTYNAIPQKKGPKGSRAKVISELRETQRQTSLSAKVQNRLNGVGGPPAASSPQITSGLLTSDTVKECLDFFFAHMYSSLPILQRQRIDQQAMYMDTTADTYCFLAAMCAFMMFQPGMSVPGMSNNDPYGLDVMPGANIISGTLLMEEAIKVRKTYDYLDSPTLNGICTSYFLFACHYALDMHPKAWYHLREATTLAHMIGMNKEETYLQFDNVDASRRRRLYWLLFITERAYALQHGRPVTLQASINAPTVTDDPTDPLASQLNGFVMLVNLFRPFDETVVNVWGKTRADCSSNFSAALKNQFREMMPAYADADTQFHDAAKNQQWVKNLAWQVGLANGNGNGLSYQYPVDVSTEVLSMASAFPVQTMQTIGLVEKLLSITADLTDVLPLQPASRVPYIDGPREYLNQVLDLLAIVRNGEHRFVPLLLLKVHDVLPRLANPMLQNAPESACNVDIFDGFGNAGMAQPPCLPLEECDTKFPVQRMDEFKTEPSPGGTSAQSGNDLSSPYVSSPPLITPGIEYPHGLAPEFPSMSDVVMNPMGAHGHGHGAGSTMNPPGVLKGQHGQHPQQALMSSLQNLNHGLIQAPNITMAGQNLDTSQVMNTLLSQGLNSAMSSMGTNGMTVRQQPQRANSFAMPPPQVRTVGDFHALQRANSDLSTMGSLGMNNLGQEMDFNTLR